MSLFDAQISRLVWRGEDFGWLACAAAGPGSFVIPAMKASVVVFRHHVCSRGMERSSKWREAESPFRFHAAMLLPSYPAAYLPTVYIHTPIYPYIPRYSCDYCRFCVSSASQWNIFASHPLFTHLNTHSFNQSINQSINQLFNHSFNQLFNQSIIHSFNQSIYHSFIIVPFVFMFYDLILWYIIDFFICWYIIVWHNIKCRSILVYCSVWADEFYSD